MLTKVWIHVTLAQATTTLLKVQSIARQSRLDIELMMLMTVSKYALTRLIVAGVRRRVELVQMDSSVLKDQRCLTIGTIAALEVRIAKQVCKQSAPRANSASQSAVQPKPMLVKNVHQGTIASLVRPTFNLFHAQGVVTARKVSPL